MIASRGVVVAETIEQSDRHNVIAGAKVSHEAARAASNCTQWPGVAMLLDVDDILWVYAPVFGPRIPSILP